MPEIITTRRRHDIYANLGSFLLWFAPMTFSATNFSRFTTDYDALENLVMEHSHLLRVVDLLWLRWDYFIQWYSPYPTSLTSVMIGCSIF